MMRLTRQRHVNGDTLVHDKSVQNAATHGFCIGATSEDHTGRIYHRRLHRLVRPTRVQVKRGNMRRRKRPWPRFSNEVAS